MRHSSGGPKLNWDPVFACTFIGLLFVSFCTVFVVANRNDRNRDQQILTAHQVSVQTVAQSINVDSHRLIQPQSAPNSGEAQIVESQLAAMLRPNGLADSAGTVVRDALGRLVYAIDVRNSEKGERESGRFTPIDSPHPELVRAFDLGTKSVRPVVSTRAGRQWVETFVPVLNGSGQTEFVVVGSIDLAHAQGLYSKSGFPAVPIIVCCLATSLALSWVFSSWIAKRRSRFYSDLAKRRGRTVLECIAVTAVIVVGSQFYFQQQNRSKSFAAEQDALAKLKVLSTTSLVLNSIRSERAVSADSVQENLVMLEQVGYSAVANRIVQLLAQQSDKTKLNGLVDQLSLELAEAQAKERNQVEKSVNLEKTHFDETIQFISIAFALGVLALLLVRVIGTQEQVIEEVKEERNEANARYQRVVGGLPMGLFVFKNDEIVFTNKTWNETFTVSDASGLERFRKSIHSQDADRVIKEIREAARLGRAFETTFRVIMPTGNEIHIESRGTADLDRNGECTQLVGFTLDVSEMVETRLTMQRTFEEVESKNRLLTAAFGELEANLENIVRALVRAVEAKDPYTAGHSERVKTYSLWLGHAIGLTRYELRILELGTLVHDVGKIGTPDAILTKPGRLTDEEFAQIKLHPEYGVKILESISLFNDCLPIVRSHHEKLNGKGYPDGLAGDQIPLLVRISTIADIFDAMTSTRAYRRGMSAEDVLRIMGDMTDSGELDPELFTTFVGVVREKGVLAQDGTDQAA